MNKLLYRLTLLSLFLCFQHVQAKDNPKHGFRTLGSISPGGQTIFTDATATTLALVGPDIPGHSIQWFISTNGADYYPISGATGTTYTPTGSAALTYYRANLTATSAPTSGTSDFATVTRVAHLAAGTASPAAVNTAYNTSPGMLTGTAATGGIGTITYQWQSGPNTYSFSDISGATGLTYTPPALTTEVYYRLKGTASSETVYTNLAKVSLFVQPGTISPATGQVVHGSSPPLLTASNPQYGDGYYYYQWQKSEDSTNWTNMFGATLQNLQPDGIVKNTWYRQMVSSNGVSAYTLPAKFYEYQDVQPGILFPDTLRENLYGAYGLNQFPASGGNGVFAYQWQQSANGTTWIDIAGQTGWQYAPYGLTATTYFRLKVTSTGVTRYTNTLVCQLPLYGGVIGLNSAVISSGGSVTLSGVQNASGGGCGSYTYSYQQSNDGYNWTTASGTTVTGITRTTWFRRVASCGNTQSSSNLVRVKIADAGALTPDTTTRATAGTETLVPMPNYPVGINAANQNYIKSRIFTKPGIADQATADAVTAIQDVDQTTVFFDGLGRTRQTVKKQATPDGSDWIVPTFYDPYGRETKSYLGYSDAGNSGNFRTNPGTAQPVFYNTQYQNKESYYYSNTVYEPSPVNKALETMVAGKTGTGKGVGVVSLQRSNMVYDSVVMWSIDNVNGTLPVKTGYYLPGTLSVTEMIDENDNVTISYKDMNSLQIMEKKEISDQLTVGYTGWQTVMYVYDDLSRKRFVITPKAVEAIRSNWVMNSTVAADLCFQYRFDYRNQKIVEKCPGADSTEFVYSKRGKLVAKRDGNLESIAFWHVHYYDSQDRERMNGLLNLAYTRDQMQALVYSKPLDPINSLPFSSESYVKDLVNMYYDDYTYTGNRAFVTTDLAKLQAGSNFYPLASPAAASKLTRGLATGIRTRVDYEDAGPFFVNNIFYDDKGNVVQTIRDNISGGLSISYNLWSFTGKLLSTYLKQTNPASTLTPQTTVLSMYHYDLNGRKDSVKKRINDNLLYQQTIAVNDYNELSELATKRVNATSSGQLETWTYTHNIRHALLGTNIDYVNTPNSSSNWYGEELSFDYGFGNKRRDAEVAGVSWKGASDGVARALGFSYDNLSRLTGANFSQQNNGSVNWTKDQVDFTSTFGYDVAGNMASMKQIGMDGISIKTLDSLKFGYVSANSNKLLYTTDKRNGNSLPADFKETVNDESQDYTYDYSGNITSDNNKGIASQLYNHLNQTNTQFVTGKGVVYYMYTGLGEKVRKMIQDTTGGTTKITLIDYIDGLEYDSSRLTQISHEEGRILPVYKNNQLSGFTFNYFGKSHTGDVTVELTTKSDTTRYPLTNELAARAVENSLFSNVDSTAGARPAVYPADNTTNPNDYVTILNAATGKKIGPGLVLRVMAGDKVSGVVKALYKNAGANTSSTTSSAMVTSILQTFASGGVTDGVHNSSGGTGTINSLSSGIYDGLKTKDPLQNLSTKPKAYLTYVLFDDQFNMVDQNSGVVQVQGAIDSLVPLVVNEMTAKKSGFWYFYLSNESSQNVYFDNLIVTHISGPLVEQTSYYPYGGVMAGISCRSLKGGKYAVNKMKFNGKEFQTGEFGSVGTDLYDFENRQYDPMAPHFTAVDPLAASNEKWSPYVFANCNPVRFTDPDGRASFDVTLTGAQAQAAFAEVQRAVKDKLVVTMDEKGKLGYSKVDGATLDERSERLIRAIDDHTVNVNVSATNNMYDSEGHILIGGGLMYAKVSGVMCTTEQIPSDVPLVQTGQEINVENLVDMSTFCANPGQDIMHEIDESHIAGKNAQISGIDYDRSEGQYNAAHFKATYQTADLHVDFTDGKGHPAVDKNTAPVTNIYIERGENDRLILRQLILKK
jgi:RHS repeat-associated protein